MRACFWMLVLLALGCSTDGEPSTSATSDSSPPSSNDPLRYLALGDSYTIGENVSEAERWPVQLAARLREQGIQVAPAEIIARTGWTTDELGAAIDRAPPTPPYQLVILLIGVNNQYRGCAPEEFRRQFRNLVQRAIGFADGAPDRVIVLSIPDWGVMPFAKGRNRERIAGEIDTFNVIAREETGAYRCHFVDVTEISRKAATDSTLVARDGLHPSGEMYRLWVEALLPVVYSAIAPKKG